VDYVGGTSENRALDGQASGIYAQTEPARICTLAYMNHFGGTAIIPLPSMNTRERFSTNSELLTHP